jgi:acetyl esterase/lipase
MPHFPIPEHLARSSFPLWDGPAPLSHGEEPEDIPSLTPYGLKRSGPPAPVLLIYPGGGYVEHGFDHGLSHLAGRFQQRGIAAFLLRYRLSSAGYYYPVQLLDGQRAVRLVRHRAAEWNLDPARIAVMGFSAGGHLASMLETHFDAGDRQAADPVDRQSCRPNAVVLIYPVISLLRKPATGTNLLGPNPDPALEASLSSETQVTLHTPPTLLVHGEDDQMADFEHSRLMFSALQTAGVPSEFHSYPIGEHGFGSFTHIAGPPGWLERVEAWLAGRGFGP